MKQDVMGGTDISWTICKSFAPHHTRTSPLSFLQAGYPSCCPTDRSKHWRQM